jgi:hypothetical protein
VLHNTSFRCILGLQMISLRNLVSVLLGLIICNAVFGILAVTTMLVWPEYGIYGHRWLDQRIFSFPPIMASINLFFWMAAFAAAAWATAKFAQDHRAAWAMAGLVLIRASYIHLFREWPAFPWWYNSIVVGSVLPMAWLGIRLDKAGSKAGAAVK